MPDRPAEGKNPFWDYSLALYRGPGVDRACLYLQDTHGLDVNLLLFCCWAGHNGHPIDPEEMSHLVKASEPWQAEFLRPLRAARRYLKGSRGGLPNKAGPLYEAILANELKGEELEQALLVQALSLHEGNPSARTAAANLRAYLSFCNVALRPEETKIAATLLETAFPELMPKEAVHLLTY